MQNQQQQSNQQWNPVEISPKLYGRDKNGKVKLWYYEVYERVPDKIAKYIIFHGQWNGRLQQTERFVTEGKNLGKKNETTAVQQCISEVKKKWVDKKEKENYCLTPTGNQDEVRVKKFYPMLAQTYVPKESGTKHKNVIMFPCYIQPKLDGVRCIASFQHNTVYLQSRTGTHFSIDNFPHIVESLTTIFQELAQQQQTIVFDGELYTHDLPFEVAVGLIKKQTLTDKDRELLKKIHYHIYDVVDVSNTIPFYARNKTLNKIEIDAPVNRDKYAGLFRVETCIAQTEAEYRDYFRRCVDAGYEGVMLRNIEGKYTQNYRSKDLQKYKEFMESEYTIVGFTEGEGRDQGTVIWECEIEEGGARFGVRPKGTIEYRRELFADAEKYIGQKLTVVYQELSEYGVPRFPVGKCIRIDA